MRLYLKNIKEGADTPPSFLEETHMDNRAIYAVQEYIGDLKEPPKRCKKEYFAQRSYRRWAAAEILRCLRQHRLTPPVITVENFMSRMGQYAQLNSNTGHIFAIASETAADILDILYAMH